MRFTQLLSAVLLPLSVWALPEALPEDKLAATLEAMNTTLAERQDPNDPRAWWLGVGDGPSCGNGFTAWSTYGEGTSTCNPLTHQYSYFFRGAGCSLILYYWWPDVAPWDPTKVCDDGTYVNQIVAGGGARCISNGPDWDPNNKWFWKVVCL